ncbi:MAG: LacI family DNA-binding transcriptional regulator [Eubacteriales bacterium]|nr:LacI family DNA-binding transcriptional regulator [Eubacteriales bacterium]
MAGRVTIQDIADALGVSRNTVSKALNNTGILAEATKEKVLQKAMEMGYKQFSYVNYTNQMEPGYLAPASEDCSEIALFTAYFMDNSHFGRSMLDKFQQEISILGYSLTMHRVLPANLENMTLPASYNPERTAGIVCIELFNYEYAQMVCGLGKPTLFVDGPLPNKKGPLNTDFLCMDNQTHIFSVVNHMAEIGKTRIGFIGQYNHCTSFYERYIAYRNAMYLAGLPIDESHCLIHNYPGVERPNGEDYLRYLEAGIAKMDALPDIFICANDFVALDAMRVFKKLGISVPEDVYLCGFDDSPESRIVTPALTTIHIHTQIMGFSAAQLLLSRIKEPTLNNRTIYTETSLIYRASTND